jgi:hypothetical protein
MVQHMDPARLHHPPLVSAPSGTEPRLIRPSLAVTNDALAIHRFQLAIVLAIAEVFAVYGTEFIFSSPWALAGCFSLWWT